MKTQLTKQAERAVWNNTSKQGTFGCFEVTIGWFGKEIVDYMTYDTKSEVRCYEIKTSKSDFLSKANKTFIGNFNYFVMPCDLYSQLLKEDCLTLLRYINSYGVGVYTFGKGGWICQKKAKRKSITHAKTSEVIESMLRSTHREVEKFYKLSGVYGSGQED